MIEKATPAYVPDLTGRVSKGVWLLTDPGAASLGVRVAFTGRHRGRSRAPFGSLNLSVSVGDDADAVIANRAAVADAAGFSSVTLALLRQVHGDRVIEIAGQPGGDTSADAMTTARPGVTLGILTADCAPVALAGRDRVAMVHAGWRGLASGVVARAAEALGEVVAAWVGPCIRACCYEVGAEVVDAFSAAGLPVADESHVDVMAAAAQAARASGARRVATAGLCTSCEEELLFSYRRDGATGRQGGFIGLLAGNE